jgi:hypothetical protein
MVPSGKKVVYYHAYDENGFAIISLYLYAPNMTEWYNHFDPSDFVKALEV